MNKWIFYHVFLCLSLILCAESPAQQEDRFQPTEIFIESNHSRLFCRVIGKGKPLIVIHGTGLSQDYLLPHLYPLAEDHFVIFYDQRGSGQSTGEISPEFINIPNLVADLDRIRQAFDFEQISILGHSWGGFLAMHYAIAHPKSVDKLVLSNSLPASSEERNLYLEEYKNRTAPYQQELSAISNTPEFKSGDPEVVERFYRIIFRTYFYHPEKVELLNLQMSPAASINSRKIFQLTRESIFNHSYNLHESLRSLRIPTLIIHGETDPMPQTGAQKIYESIPGSTYILLKQCGHFPFIERKEAYLNDIREFLNFSDK